MTALLCVRCAAATRHRRPAPVISRSRARVIAGAVQALIQTHAEVRAPLTFDGVLAAFRRVAPGALVQRTATPPVSVNGRTCCLFGTPCVHISGRLGDEAAIDVLLHEWAHVLFHLEAPFVRLGIVVERHRAVTELEAELFVALLRAPSTVGAPEVA